MSRPELGSVTAKHILSSPEIRRGRCFWRCSSVPNFTIGMGPKMFRWMALAPEKPAPDWATACIMIAASVRPRPAPPTLSGMATPSQPPCAMAATNSSGKIPVSSVRRQYSSSKPTHSLATPSRMASCSSVSQNLLIRPCPALVPPQVLEAARIEQRGVRAWVITFRIRRDQIGHRRGQQPAVAACAHGQHHAGRRAPAHQRQTVGGGGPHPHLVVSYGLRQLGRRRIAAARRASVADGSTIRSSRPASMVAPIAGLCRRDRYRPPRPGSPVRSRGRGRRAGSGP